eukprot:m.99693 g.99693  ORF g.99693 m.99693 type:complete len:66 (+) comp37073_c0_seq28:1171-1368(+)
MKYVKFRAESLLQSWFWFSHRRLVSFSSAAIVSDHRFKRLTWETMYKMPTLLHAGEQSRFVYYKD